MDRKTINWICELIKNKPAETTRRNNSAIGRNVIGRFQCGRVNGNQLIFTAQDKTELRRQIQTEFNIDPFTSIQLPTNRVEMAQHHKNEKLAGAPVSQDHILLNSPNGSLLLNQQNIQLPTVTIPNVGFMCLGSGIKQINHQAIVVVENLAIMQLCSQLILPEHCYNALWLYRGAYKSGARIDACYDLLKRFGQQKQIIAFTDMDPKGLEIALTLPHVNEWLGPTQTEWKNCLTSHYANTNAYDRQARSMTFLLNQTNQPQGFAQLINLLYVQRSSYRQEHMYAHNIPLSSLLIKPVQN